MERVWIILTALAASDSDFCEKDGISDIWGVVMCKTSKLPLFKKIILQTYRHGCSY